jgi:hypothetical protein
VRTGLDDTRVNPDEMVYLDSRAGGEARDSLQVQVDEIGVGDLGRLLRDVIFFRKCFIAQGRRQAEDKSRKIFNADKGSNWPVVTLAEGKYPAAFLGE